MVFREGSWTVESVPAVTWQDPVVASVGEFLRALVAGGPPPTTGEEGRETVRWLEEAYRRPSLGSRLTAAGRPSGCTGWSAGQGGKEADHSGAWGGVNRN